MFGYVLPVKAELKMRDFEHYRAAYCGVCKQLGKSFGVFSRFLLNYDLVLVGVMADALSGEAGDMRCEGCLANPFAKRCTLHTTHGLNLAADGLVILSWHKLRDNLADEKWHKRLLYGLASPVMKGMYNKAARRRPEIAAEVEAQMERQRQLEANGCASLDEACEPTAKMCAAIFGRAGTNERQQRILERLGLFAGQIVYLLDAAEDYQDDAKNGRYNVFIQAGMAREQAVEAAKRRCNMAAGEIALCYNLLDLRQYKDILDNIFFLGLPQGIAAAGVKRTSNKGAKHGQINSV